MLSLENWVHANAPYQNQPIVVGLGTGEHVEQWMDSYPQAQMTVIETRSSVVDSFLERRSDLASRVDFIVLSSPDELLKHPLMGRLIRELPPVFCEPRFLRGDEERLREIFRMATGRSMRGLSYFMKAFGFETERSIEASDDGRFLTVKDLGVYVDTYHADHPKAPLIRVLRELIA